MASPFRLIHLETGLIDLIAGNLGYKYGIVHSTTIPLGSFSQSNLSSAVRFSLLDMDKNKKEEHSRGGPSISSQHHTEDMALSLQDKVSCDQENLKSSSSS